MLRFRRPPRPDRSGTRTLLTMRGEPIRGAAEIPGLRLLRPTGMIFMATQEVLGHSTTAITLDTYSHVTPTMQREAAAAMDAVLAW